MTSSSSLYGSVTTQNTNSGNSTSLYGEAGTPIPDSSGNVVVRGDLYVLSGNILTTAATGNIFPTNATTINLGNAATSVNIGASTGTTTINNNLVVNGTINGGGADFGNITIGVTTDNTINTTSGQLVLQSATGEIDTNTTSILSTNSSSFFLLNSPTTVNAFQGATTLTMGATTGTTTIRNNLVADSGDFNNITIGVVDGNTIATTSGDLNLLPTGNNGVNITSGSDGPTLITRNSAVTTAVRSLALSAETSLTPAVGFGNTLEWQVEAQPGNIERAGYIGVNLTDITAGSEDFSMYFGLMENGAAYTSKMILDSTGSLALDNDLTIGGNSVSLAQDTAFSYSENNNRLNRPSVISTTGNTSGWRVRAPNATTSAAASMSVANTNDASNNKFLSVQATGSTTEPFRIVSGEYIAGVLNASGDSISIRDGATQYATINPAGPTVGSDLTTKSYVDGLIPNVPTYDTNVVPVTGGVELDLQEIVGATVTIVGSTKFLGGTNVTVSETSPNEITIDAPVGPNTTYDFAATSATGGANLNLTGSDSSTDTVKLTNAGHITATYTSATEVTLGSDATDANTVSTIVARDASGNFSASGATLGNITVGVATDNTIGTTTGDLILDSASGIIQLADPNISSTVAQTWTVVDNNASALSIGATGKAGILKIDSTDGAERVVTSGNLTVNGSQVLVTQNTTYVPPTSALSTASGNNGVVAVSSAGGANGYGASFAARYHSGDTGAGVNNAASLVLSSATGSSSAPAGSSANQVLGALNFDGYTAGTSNNYVSQIATANAGGGFVAVQPIQAQGYARQAFTNSTTFTTAVTGASGTGSVATLLFTTQNTAPYAVGQSVTIAGMTPSGYNGTYTITAATTSSISYANATTGFTSGGTIAAANTVTAAGMGFRIRGFANSTNITPANRFNFMDLTASAATFKSNAYTFANEVITGSTLTATNYMTLGATTGSINQDTFTVKNTAGTSTYITAVSTGTDIRGTSLSTITRTTVGTPGVLESRPSFNIQLSRSDQAAPNDQDGTGFRYRVNGSNATNYTIADMSAVYRTGGDNAWTLYLANGDQTGATFSGLATLQSKISQTTISAGTASGTPGASTVSTVATFAPTSTTLAASGTAYATFASGSAQITNSGRTTISRSTPGTGLLLTQQTAAAGPADNESTDFRLGVAGTVTSSNFARIDGTYKSSGDNEIGLSVSDDSFTADTDRIYIGSRASTKILATPAGGGTSAITAEFTQLATTIKSDAVTLQTAAGASLPGNKVTYSRQYGDFSSLVTQANPVANAENLMIFGTTNANNGVTIVSNGTALTRITFANAGIYNLQFSAQLSQSAGGAHNSFIWIKKNGTTVANTAGDTRIAGNGDRIMASWNYLVTAAAGDYYELAWAATDTSVILEYVAAAGVVPGIPSTALTVTPVGA